MEDKKRQVRKSEKDFQKRIDKSLQDTEKQSLTEAKELLAEITKWG